MRGFFGFLFGTLTFFLPISAFANDYDPSNCGGRDAVMQLFGNDLPGYDVQQFRVQRAFGGKFKCFYNPVREIACLTDFSRKWESAVEFSGQKITDAKFKTILNNLQTLDRLLTFVFDYNWEAGGLLSSGTLSNVQVSSFFNSVAVTDKELHRYGMFLELYCSASDDLIRKSVESPSN
jgi:hypothetical protein